MSDKAYRALVVDDEAVARRAVMWALSNEKFECTPAMDGVDALEKMRQRKYDLVVTDLRMPYKHGHALITDLLAGGAGYIPVLVAHSSIDEPKLTKDLMIRGVDDVVCKPTNYAAFAAKLKGLVIRRRHIGEERPAQPVAPVEPVAASVGPGANTKSLVQTQESADALRRAPLSIKEFDARLADVTRIFPVSNASAEVSELLGTNDFDSSSLANIICSDAVLTVELLRAANSTLCTRTGRKINEPHEAIAKLGAKRIGDISLEVCAFAGLTRLLLPWFDNDLASRRSLASVASAKRILAILGSRVNESGVIFSSSLYPLTRVVVGSAYANVYDALIAESDRNGTPLQSLEREVFPRTPSEATSQTLLKWRLPTNLFHPLSHADDSFESLADLKDPSRTWVKVFKTAVLVGEYAVDKWLPWEVKPELPPDLFFASLKIENISGFIDEVRSDILRLTK